MIINNTPVRTSKSFNINNISVKDNVFNNEINKFDNVDILNNSSKVIIEQNKTPINLKYGLGQELVNEINNKSNQNIKIVVDSKTNTLTKIDFNFDEENATLIENIDITANENTNSTFVIKYEAKQNSKCYHNGIIKLNAKKNSKINLVVINLLNDSSNNFITIDNNIAENSKVDYTMVDFGGQNTVSNYYSNINGDYAESNLNTIYIGKNQQVLDLNYIAELYGKYSKANIEVQGALNDKARKSFKGTIDFKKGCKKAIGEENENCMLLSDTAKSIALPMLLCSEEDVEGSHSTSAGKVGSKELFYIMSRGFDLKEAQKLLVRANFNKILNGILDNETKCKICKEIDERLN